MLSALSVGLVLAACSAAAGGASPALAQGSEPRLLIPSPGGTAGQDGGVQPRVVPSVPSVQGGTQPTYPPPSSQVQPGQYPGTPPPAPQAGTPATARLDVRMTQLEQDLRAVTGRLEEVTYQLRRLDDRLNKVAADVDYRLSQTKAGEGEQAANAGPPRSEDPGAPTAAAGAAAGAGATAGAAARPSAGSSGAASSPAAGQTSSASPRSPREQYAAAFAQLEKRNYDEAAAGFSDFLKQNPGDPLVDNARYWLGESYYARGEYARSAELFLDSYEKNKSGPKAPDTLLKLGLSLAGLQKNKEACASFRELNRAFPNAPATVKERAGQETKRLACS